MYLKKLILQNFRNYSRLDVDFNQEHNLIIGENGQGKTNILESIYLLGMMKSFRPVLDKDLIRQGENSYFLQGLFLENDFESSISIGVHQNKKLVQHNQTEIKKISSLIGNLKVVIFTQPDIQLIIGSPSIRRKYIDITLSLTYKRYLELLQQYNKVMKQRNIILKKNSDQSTTQALLKVWDQQLIEYGSEIMIMRKDFFDPINDLTQSLYNTLSFDMSDFHLAYKSSIGNTDNKDLIADEYMKKLLENRSREIQYKQTLFGPHKDDFAIKSGQTDFKRFASQGQCRAGALTLKLAMTKYIENMTQCKMILLLDDVLLDLDDKKKHKFLDLVQGRQNFFTSTSLHGLERIQEQSSIYHVSDNSLTLE